MSRHALVCRCGDCRHWEILAPEPVFLGFLGTAWAHPQGKLRCMTCGREFAATVTVDASEHLTEIPVDVDEAGMPVAVMPVGGMPITVDDEVPVILDLADEVMPPFEPPTPEPVPDPPVAEGGESGGGGGGADFSEPAPVEAPVDVPDVSE